MQPAAVCTAVPRICISLSRYCRSEVYYIKDDFSLATGWLTIPNDNNTYYFDPDTGKMVSEKTVIG